MTSLSIATIGYIRLKLRHPTAVHKIPFQARITLVFSRLGVSCYPIIYTREKLLWVPCFMWKSVEKFLDVHVVKVLSAIGHCTVLCVFFSYIDARVPGLAWFRCFWQSFPDGYNTGVGEGGFQLSGGQKQVRYGTVRNGC